MPSYVVVMTASSKKELEKLPASVISRVYPRIEKLALNPRPARCKKLKGGDAEWRIRAGNYRVVYTIDDKKLFVEVTRIRHRSAVYER